MGQGSQVRRCKTGLISWAALRGQHQRRISRDFRFGSNSDLRRCLIDVRSCPNSRQPATASTCRFRAKLRSEQKSRPLSLRGSLFNWRGGALIAAFCRSLLRKFLVANSFTNLVGFGKLSHACGNAFTIVASKPPVGECNGNAEAGRSYQRQYGNGC
jgi:hypothetical protein